MQGLALRGEEHRSALAEGESGAPPVGRGEEGKGGEGVQRSSSPAAGFGLFWGRQSA